MPRRSTWLVPLLAATWLVPLLASTGAVLEGGDLAQIHHERSLGSGHGRSLLHGVHVADSPEEFLDHISADGKDPATFLLALLQGNSTVTGSLDLGQLSSLLWYLKGHL
jgi:hypothetical protein